LKEIAQVTLHKPNARGHRLERLSKPAEEVYGASSSASAEAKEAKEGYPEVKEENLDARTDETDAPGMQHAVLEARRQLFVSGEDVGQPGSRRSSRGAPSDHFRANQERMTQIMFDSEPNDAAGELPEVQEEAAPVKPETATPTKLDVDPVADQSSLRLPSLATPRDIFSPQLVSMMDSRLELQKDAPRPWTVPSLSKSTALPWAEDLVHLQQVYVPRKPPSRRSPRKSNKEKGWWPPAASTCTGWM